MSLSIEETVALKETIMFSHDERDTILEVLADSSTPDSQRFVACLALRKLMSSRAHAQQTYERTVIHYNRAVR